MSEFFKALEQAERDRQREQRAGASDVAVTAVPETVDAPEVRGSAPPVPAPAAPAPEVSAPAAPPSVASPAVAAAPAAPTPAPPKPAPAEPAVAAAGPNTAPPLASGVTSAASGVFKPSLRSPAHRARSNGRVPYLVAQSEPGSIEAEAYRTVRANIELMARDHAPRHIAVTSAMGGDGKSTTAANLAVVAAQAGRRVCLVDADLHHPNLHDVFGFPNVDGFAAALEQGIAIQMVARPTDVPNLSLVVAGRSPHETFHDLVTSQRLERFLRESDVAFDLVVFDTPPVMSTADALSVAAVADGVILVVRSGSAPVSVLRRAIGQVKHVNGRVLGVLMNRVDLRGSQASYYGYRRPARPAGMKA